MPVIGGLLAATDLHYDLTLVTSDTQGNGRIWSSHLQSLEVSRRLSYLYYSTSFFNSAGTFGKGGKSCE
jgi:hypothetical protein